MDSSTSKKMRHGRLQTGSSLDQLDLLRIIASFLSFTQIFLYSSTNRTLGYTHISGAWHGGFVFSLPVKFFPMAPSLARGPPIFCVTRQSPVLEP